MKSGFPRIDRNTISKIFVWYGKLSRWKKGIIIGLVIGSVMAGLTYWQPTNFEVGEVVLDLHMGLVLPWYVVVYLTFGEYSRHSGPVFLAGITILIILFYTLTGLVVGIVHQIDNPFWKWSLTVIISCFLVCFYLLNVI